MNNAALCPHSEIRSDFLHITHHQLNVKNHSRYLRGSRPLKGTALRAGPRWLHPSLMGDPPGGRSKTIRTNQAKRDINERQKHKFGLLGRVQARTRTARREASGPCVRATASGVGVCLGRVRGIATNKLKDSAPPASHDNSAASSAIFLGRTRTNTIPYGTEASAAG